PLAQPRAHVRRQAASPRPEHAAAGVRRQPHVGARLSRPRAHRGLTNPASGQARGEQGRGRHVDRGDDRGRPPQGVIASASPMGRPTAAPGRAPGSGEIPTQDARAGRIQTAGLSGFRAGAVGDLAALALGLGAGMSPLFGGYWSDTLSSVLGLCVVVAAGVMVATGRMPVPSGRALLAVGGLAGLAVVALVSALWSPAPDGAVVWGGRRSTSAAVVLLAPGLARDRRRRGLLLGAVGAGLTAVAVVTLARMLGPGAPSLFLAGRLSAPLGYAGGTACAFVLATWLFLGVALRPRPLEAGAGMFGMVLMACLAVL